MGSVAFEAARNSTEAIAAWTVELYQPAFHGSSIGTFCWSTTPLTLAEDGLAYSGVLLAPPKGRNQMGAGNDYAEFTISHEEYLLYTNICTPPTSDLIETMQVTIRKAYCIATNVWNSEILFKGTVKDVTLDDSDNSMKFTVLSDMSTPNRLVGGRILTRDRCGTDFNYNGALSASESLCGWQSAQGGNPFFCSKQYLGADSCDAHGNKHRFVAVKGMNTATITIDPGYEPPFDPPPECFAETAYVLMADWSVKSIPDVRMGDTVMGFDLFDNDKLTPAQTLFKFRNLHDEIWTAKFENAQFEVKRNHLFYLGNMQFAPVGYLASRPVMGIDSNRREGQSSLLSIEHSVEQLFVYNLHTSTNNYIVTDKDRNFFYKVHNRKPIDGDILPFLN